MALEGGSRFGDYLLGKKLGQGGYGIVWAARDTKMDREIAIKILKADQVARPQVLKRFLQEARSAAKVVHPGIVTVYECGHVIGTGTGDDGTVYIAMELLLGEGLGRRMKRGRLSTEHAIELAVQVASALEAAHGKGIVHRDLKPDNLFLVPDASMPHGERVKVLDFGIAKLADTEDVTSVHTSSMMMMGTPKYMSPEQCRSTAAVDHRTDIYSLGCILFELFTGRTPFVGDAGEQIAKHQLEATPSMLAIAPEVPKALDRLVVRMLAKKMEDRPSTMAKVQEALRALVAPIRDDDRTNREDEDQASDRAVTDRAATQADGPLSKRGVAKLEAAMRDVMGRERVPDDQPTELDKTQMDITQKDGVSLVPETLRSGSGGVIDTGDVPRLSTNPDRAATKAQSMEMLRARWWKRPQGMAAIGGAVVLVIVGVVMVGRSDGAKGGAPIAVVQPVVPERSAEKPSASAPVTSPVTPPIATIASCEAHAAANEWDDLLTCADRLADAGAARAARTTAVLELRNHANWAKLVEALGRKQPAEALMWLERIDETSVYRPEAVEAFAAALPKPEAALPTCNAAKFTASAKAKLAGGQYREALVDIEASLRCAVDPSLYRLGALAACNGRSPAKARQFAARLPAAQLTTIRQICLRNGVELP